MPEIPSITPRQLSEIAARDAVLLLDVRTPAEFREVHAVGATNRPLDSLDPDGVVTQFGIAKNDPIYVICRSGSRAARACQKLGIAGFENVMNVDGGTEAWDAAGLPVRRGKKAISLERQVCIVAGTIVLVGALLAVLVHPYWAGLSGFVGAGLAFAGLTDTCGMGLLLAKMPWNRVPEAAAGSARSSFSR